MLPRVAPVRDEHEILPRHLYRQWRFVGLTGSADGGHSYKRYLYRGAFRGFNRSGRHRYPCKRYSNAVARRWFNCLTSIETHKRDPIGRSVRWSHRLTSIDTAISIGSGAFVGLTGLTSIEIPTKRYLHGSEAFVG
jgi:hypothetical protein